MQEKGVINTGTNFRVTRCDDGLWLDRRSVPVAAGSDTSEFDIQLIKQTLFWENSNYLRTMT
jgi:hypothetical protein